MDTTGTREPVIPHALYSSRHKRGVAFISTGYPTSKPITFNSKKTTT